MYCRFFDLDIADIPTGQQQRLMQELSLCGTGLAAGKMITV